MTREATVPPFIGDWNWGDSPLRPWPAVSYGRDWNGWATPVVTRETLQSVIADTPAYSVDFLFGHIAVVVTADTLGDWPELVALLPPDDDGNYSLEPLGFTLMMYTPDLED